MFWKRKPKIEVFVRHCNFSEVSQHKNRLAGFTRQKCYDNFLSTLDRKKVNVTYLIDTFHASEKPHFILEQTEFPVIEIKEGSETGSFLRLLDHVASLNLDPETIVYFLEDDYLHKDGWVEVCWKALRFLASLTRLSMTIVTSICFQITKTSQRKFFIPLHATGGRLPQRRIPMR
jgi:hypothetical protein